MCGVAQFDPPPQRIAFAQKRGVLALGFFGHRGGAQPTHPALRQMPCRLVLRVFLAQFSRLQTVLAYRIVQPGLARQA